MAKLIAWAGGVAFAGSLAYLVYFYLVVLAATDGPGGTSALRAALVDTALFSAFALHHSLFARPSIKRRLTAYLPPTVERTAYVWIASVLLLLVCLGWQTVAGVAYVAQGSARWLLYGVQLAGVALTARATRAIDGLALAGIRQVTASRDTRPETLSREGPFGVVRHPIYLGWVLMVTATPTMTANRMLFAVLTIGYLILAIPWEERSLVAAHGDRYLAYRQAVRWRLVPGIW